MAPRGNGEGSSALGKHSREPLAEQSTNARPKRGKSAPDSHPGENQSKASSNDKSSSKLKGRVIANSTDDEDLDESVDEAPRRRSSTRSKARIIEDTTDDEDLDEVLDVGGDILDEGVYDQDLEDLDDEDAAEAATKDKEQAEQLEDWFRYSDEKDRLAGLSS